MSDMLDIVHHQLKNVEENNLRTAFGHKGLMIFLFLLILRTGVE